MGLRKSFLLKWGKREDLELKEERDGEVWVWEEEKGYVRETLWMQWLFDWGEARKLSISPFTEKKKQVLGLGSVFSLYVYDDDVQRGFMGNLFYVTVFFTLSVLLA